MLLAALSVAVAWIYHSRRLGAVGRARRLAWGVIPAPEAHPDTTLLVTDIQVGVCARVCAVRVHV